MGLLLDGNASDDALAVATTKFCDEMLDRALKDKAFVEVLWLLMGIPQAAKSGDFRGALRALGVKVPEKPKTVAESLEAAGFAVRSHADHLGEAALRAWARRLPLAARALLLRRPQGRERPLAGGARSTTVWAIGNASEEDEVTVHGTQKPVECMRRPLLNNSAKGDAIYEPFAGSGTTIIAAESTGRMCFALEIDPRYCDVIIERWQRFSDKDAVLDGSAESFADLRNGRAAA
jgi:DNA methylase